MWVGYTSTSLELIESNICRLSPVAGVLFFCFFFQLKPLDYGLLQCSIRFDQDLQLLLLLLLLHMHNI